MITNNLKKHLFIAFTVLAVCVGCKKDKEKTYTDSTGGEIRSGDRTVVTFASPSSSVIYSMKATENVVNLLLYNNAVDKKYIDVVVVVSRTKNGLTSKSEGSGYVGTITEMSLRNKFTIVTNDSLYLKLMPVTSAGEFCFDISTSPIEKTTPLTRLELSMPRDFSGINPNIKETWLKVDVEPGKDYFCELRVNNNDESLVCKSADFSVYSSDLRSEIKNKTTTFKIPVGMTSVYIKVYSNSEGTFTINVDEIVKSPLDVWTSLGKNKKANSSYRYLYWIKSDVEAGKWYDLSWFDVVQDYTWYYNDVNSSMLVKINEKDGELRVPEGVSEVYAQIFENDGSLFVMARICPHPSDAQTLSLDTVNEIELKTYSSGMIYITFATWCKLDVVAGEYYYFNLQNCGISRVYQQNLTTIIQRKQRTGTDRSSIESYEIPEGTNTIYILLSGIELNCTVHVKKLEK